MDPSTQNTFLAQVNEAQVWTGEYFVPDLNNDGKLVPVREGIQMTKTKDGIRRIMQVAGAGELTFHGKNNGNYARLVCPFGRTAGTKIKWGWDKKRGAGTKENSSVLLSDHFCAIDSMRPQPHPLPGCLDPQMHGQGHRPAPLTLAEQKHTQFTIRDFSAMLLHFQSGLVL